MSQFHHNEGYIEDDVLHIKTKKEQKVQSLVSQVKGCVPAKLRSATQKIVYENDCVYTMSELDTACDKIWNAEKNGEIDVVGIGTDEKLNGLIVEAPEWNDEKKQTISEISGIDMEHLIFEISEGNFEDTALNSAGAGSTYHHNHLHLNLPTTLTKHHFQLVKKFLHRRYLNFWALYTVPSF